MSRSTKSFFDIYIPMTEEVECTFFEHAILTVLPTKTSIKSLCVDGFDVATVGSVEQLTLVIPSVVFVHFLFSNHIGLIKMWILYTLDSLDLYVTGSCVNLPHYIHILG